MFYLRPMMYHHQWEVVLSGALELVREIGIRVTKSVGSEYVTMANFVNP